MFIFSNKKVIQANVHHMKAAASCLVHDMMMAREQVVALVQELYLGDRGYPVGIPRNLGCHYHSCGGKGRAAIFTKGCNLLLFPGYSGKDLVTCQLLMSRGREVFVVSVYCDRLIMFLKSL